MTSNIEKGKIRLVKLRVTGQEVILHLLENPEVEGGQLILPKDEQKGGGKKISEERGDGASGKTFDG